MRILTLSPMAILTAPSGNFNVTLEYISGSSIRGALAETFLNRHDFNKSSTQKLFNRLFLSNEVIYDNAYPQHSFPVPLTARACKIQGGFKTVLSYEQKDAHGVLDFLIDFLLYEKSGHKFELDDLCKNENCRAPLERYSGWSFYNHAQQRFEGTEIKKREIARTEILPHTLTASEGQLYSIETIDEYQLFYGAIITEKTDLKDELSSLLEEKIFYIGSGRTRGLGAVEITPGDFSTSDQTILPLRTINNQNGRFDEFNLAVQNAFSKNRISGAKTYFSITLLSDLILKNEYQQYLSSLTIDQLLTHLPGDTPQSNILTRFKLLLSFTRLNRITGWSAVWKLPKHTELGISKGSVFLYECEEELTNAEKESLLRVLEVLEMRRIGERINEGFGKISICHPFHWREIE